MDLVTLASRLVGTANEHDHRLLQEVLLPAIKQGKPDAEIISAWHDWARRTGITVLSDPLGGWLCMSFRALEVDGLGDSPVYRLLKGAYDFLDRFHELSFTHGTGWKHKIMTGA